MGGGDRVITNRKLRTQIDGIIRDFPGGTVFYCSAISSALANKNRCITRKRIGMLLREREDVQSLGHSQWLVLA